MKFLEVPKKDAEKVRLELIEKKIISNDYRIFREGDFVFIPVNENYGNFRTVEREGEVIEKTPTLKEYLSSFLEPEELDQVVGSYDIVGDVAIIEVPGSLESREKEIAGAILKVNKAISTVLKKMGPMEGVYRTRKMKWLAGKRKTVALYREHGVEMLLDVPKVYFSVRLSNERKRISRLVGDHERVLALFAGVGPFPLVISKNHPETEIVAVELNPVAVQYMRRNVELNKAGNIRVLEGDVRKVVPEEYKNWADRVLMTLPKSAPDFLDVAAGAVKDGGIIHLYTFAGGEDSVSAAKKKLEKSAEKSGVCYELIRAKTVRPYAPGIFQVVLDIKIRKSS